MDWLKAIMIFTMIGFGAALVYVCATLESLVNENGNLKAQIETLKNRYMEAMKAGTDNSNRLDMFIDYFDNTFQNGLTPRMDHIEKRLNEIEIMMEDRAKETSRVFDAVQNDINEIRSEWRALKEDYGELWEGYGCAH